VAKFLEAELSSGRHGSALHAAMKSMGVPDEVIVIPDLGNNEQNQQRDALLTEARGWKVNKYLFEDFPTKVAWYEVEFTQEDIDNLLYLNHSYWRELSNGSRRVKDAAKSIKQGKVVFGQSNQAFLDVAHEIENGEEYPEIIVVAPDDKTTPIILEGHLRATAYSLAGRKPLIIRAILGVSPGIKQWETKDFS
jgi:hypothetical protein